MYLASIVRDNPVVNLPHEWQVASELLSSYSKNKTLYPFQIQALEAALITLKLYYNQKNNGELIHTLYKENGAPLKISDCNRAGFWMATGSGKTLVIVKLIELLAELIGRGLIPEKNIMFLVYRDQLIRQFTLAVNEFNSNASNNTYKINLFNLKELVESGRSQNINFENVINVCYYRADLFADSSTEKKIDITSCLNDGNWYVILDEAHKGEKNETEYSVLQSMYTRLSANGFLFNFSATFVDEIDLYTCAYNFNLEKFVSDGYGKNIYISAENADGFREQNVFSVIEKQRVVLKALILQTYVKLNLRKIRNTALNAYHNPLFLAIVNSVNSNKNQKTDLHLFFDELVKIAQGNIPEFEHAKTELLREYQTARYIFGNEKILLDENILQEISYKNVLKEIFNTDSSGSIQVLRIPGSNKEIAFQMMTASKPFALIRIGETMQWYKEALKNYEVTEQYNNDSIFNNLNEPDSSINILMGSRAFYEGWDSNRPNVIVFINIGVGKDSKKFVLQAVGRGVRIEPIRHKRRRLQALRNAGELDEATFNAIGPYSAALESLFVFGTNAENLEQVMKTLQSEGEQAVPADLFKINPCAQEKLVLIPRYTTKKQSDSGQSQFEQEIGRFAISEEDLAETRLLWNALSDEAIILKYRIGVTLLKKARNFVKGMRPSGDDRSIHLPKLLIEQILRFCNTQYEDFEKFSELDPEQDIIHFKNLRLRGNWEDAARLGEGIRVMSNLPEEVQKKKDLFGKDMAQYDAQSKRIDRAHEFAVGHEKVRLRFLAEHYYNPVLTSEIERLTILTHIISVPSELAFLQALEKEADTLTRSFDWWMFSKIDETLDTNVYIPYLNHNTQHMAKFHPDFIFWLQSGEHYHILFVDPKGSAHAGYQNKADYFTRLFGAEDRAKIFHEHNLKIRVHLRFWNASSLEVSERYRGFWADSVEALLRF